MLLLVTINNEVLLGDNVKLNNWITLGARTILGNNVIINDNVTVGDDVLIGDDVIISNDVIIGDNIIISDWVKLDNDIEVLAGFTSLSLTDKWVIHPYSIGQIRCGCFIGKYDKLLKRSKEEWGKSNYTPEQVKLVKSFAKFCRDNESLMLRSMVN